MPTGWQTDGQDQAYKLGNPGIYNLPVPASYTGNRTYTTSDLLGYTIIHDATGNVTGTMPTAASLAAAIPGCRVGDTVMFNIINGADVSGKITLALGTGGSWDPNQGAGSRSILYNSSKMVSIRFSNTTPGSESYTMWG